MTKTRQLILGSLAGIIAAILALALVAIADAQTSPTHLGRTFPQGSQVFRPFLGDDRYAVVYMPLASGRGVYFQPFLPSPGQRTPFGVAVVVQPGIYEMYGQGCETWLNPDGNSPLRSGWLMTVGVEIKEYPPTAGRNEAWVAFICDGDGASTASIGFTPVN